MFTFNDYDTFNFFRYSILSDDKNISSVLVREDREESLICRTNDAFERFNREWNHAFPNAHPSMSEFDSTCIRRISEDKYTQYDRVAKGREKAPVHQPANDLFTVPACLLYLHLCRSNCLNDIIIAIRYCE